MKTLLILAMLVVATSAGAQQTARFGLSYSAKNKTFGATMLLPHAIRDGFAIDPGVAVGFGTMTHEVRAINSAGYVVENTDFFHVGLPLMFDFGVVAFGPTFGLQVYSQDARNVKSGEASTLGTFVFADNGFIATGGSERFSGTVSWSARRAWSLGFMIGIGSRESVNLASTR